MKKRKFVKRYINKKIIFITIILSMSMVGVGYATWDEDTTINLSYETGFINPIFFIENNKPAFSDGDLIFSVLDDGHTLLVEGEIYPSFNENIIINITDEGTIPSLFKDLEEYNISDLSKFSGYNEYIESFELKIKPNNDNDDLRQTDEAFSSLNNKKLSIEQEIKILEEKISLYEKVRDYEFKYILNFEQGL